MEGNKAQTNDTANNYGSVNYYPREERIRAAVEELCNAIKDSDVYHEFQTVNKHISGYPELVEESKNYRKAVFQIQTGRDDSIDLIKELEIRGDMLHSDTLMDEYLNAELAMCRLFQRIMYMTLDVTEFDPGIDL